MNTPIQIETTITAPVEKVWEYWNNPEHIVHWAYASSDWEALQPTNDLRVGGTFSTTMAAKDKSASFDFTGTYTVVKEFERIEYNMSDGRHVSINFSTIPEGTKVVQTFDPESENSREMQQQGWQAILNNFKAYLEQ